MARKREPVFRQLDRLGDCEDLWEQEGHKTRRQNTARARQIKQKPIAPLDEVYPDEDA